LWPEKRRCLWRRCYQLATAPPTRPFKEVLAKANGLALIAELKKASPSKGLLAKAWDPKKLAQAYAQGGAAALSVVTEEKYFQGRGETIAEVKRACSLPVLRKDFIIDPYQIYETRVLNADAVLLIASLYPQARDLKKMVQLALNMSLTPVVEVHTLGELKKALRSDAEVIGINNRDLATFKVNLKNTLKIIKKIPASLGKVVVSESGIRSGKEARELWEAGVKAILVGTSLLQAKPMAPLLKELSSVGKDEI
jgi:indole-3-glycerol phosphate synthase